MKAPPMGLLIPDRTIQWPRRGIDINQKPACNANEFFVPSVYPHIKYTDSCRGKFETPTQCFCTHMLVKSILTLLNSRARDQSKPNISRKNLSITAAGRMGEQQVKQAGVLITYNPISYLIETLDIKFQTYKLYEAHDREAFFAEHSQSIRGVVCGGHDGINAQMIDALPCLEIVAVNGVGIDKVDLAKCKQRNIAVTNTPDVLTDDVADLAIALMLDALRQISAADHYVRQGLWQSKGDYKLTCKDQAMYPQSNSVQQDLQQRLHTTGGLLQQQQQQQQSSVEQQKQLLQAQTQRLSDVPTTSVESSGQTGQQNIMDWQEKIYQKLQKLKDMYFPDLRELLQRLSIKCQQPMAADQLEKLKLYRVNVHRMMQYFQVPKHNILHNFPEDKIDAVEKQIQSVLNSFKPGKPALQQQQLSGKRVGIVGLGRIGSAIAKRAEAFGCSIAYYSRSQKPNVSFTYHSNVIDLAASSDILVVACSLTKDTRHIINKSVLDALGAKGTLVNIGRGALVDEKELVKALLEGRIQGAGLDVFENEPHVPEELYSLENVVLVPHVGSGTWETRKGMADLVVGNLEAHFLEKPLLTPVPL